MTPADLAALITPEIEPNIPCRNADPEDWFPDRVGRYDSTEYAARLCFGCPLLAECLDTALGYRPAGIWGGTTERQRADILRRRNGTMAGAR